MLRVMAEISCAPSASQDRHSQQHPSWWAQTPLPQGQTHFCRRDSAVLSLHGEALGREKKGASVGSRLGTIVSGHSPWGRETTLSRPE